MLSKITFTNFKSFKNTTSVDFKKTNYATLPQNVDASGVLKGCIFVGSNAAGKSTVLLGVKLLLDFLFSERNMDSGIFLCMFGEKDYYSISYEFVIDDSNIQYTFEVTPGKSIISEKLYVDSQLMLERMGQHAKSYIADATGTNYDASDVGKDTLFLRTLYFNTKFASNQTLGNWMAFLKGSIYINMFDKLIQAYNGMELSISKHLEREGCQSINELFNKYNFEQTIEYGHSSKGERFQLTVGNRYSDKLIFFKRKGINAPIPFAEESLGNQNLLSILPSFLHIIEHGGMLLIDEFSSGFHNDLESLLVRYFMDKADKAQMLFVSHSTNLLSNSILRPDQEYAVSFHAGEGSFVKRFSTEKPRSAQNVEKMYVSGVFGGLPNYRDIADED